MSSHNSTNNTNNSNYNVSIPGSSSVSESKKRRHSHSLKKKTPPSKIKMRKYHSNLSLKGDPRMVYSPKRKKFKKTSSQLEEDQIKFKINLKKTRKKFLKKLAANNLNMDVQYEYIMALVKITENLNGEFANHIFKKFDFKGTEYEILNNQESTEGKQYNLSVFGGIQFFLIYYEAINRGVIKLSDKKLKKTIKNFLKYSTTDIDIHVNFDVVPEFYCEPSEENEENGNSIPKEEKEFSQALNASMIESYNNLFEVLMNKENTKFIKKIKFILNANSSLKHEMNESNSEGIGTPILKNVGYDNTLTAKITKKSVFNTGDSGKEIIRVNFNSCLGNSNNCDHIFDILNMYKDNNYNIPINFQTLGVDLSLISLLENSFKNITRLIRVSVESIEEGVNTIEELRELFKSFLVSTNITKYYQGYYRVLMVYEILKKCNKDFFNNIFKVYGSSIAGYMFYFSEVKGPYGLILQKNKKFHNKIKKFKLDMNKKYTIDFKKSIENKVDKLDIDQIKDLVDKYNIKIVIPGKGKIGFEKKFLKKFKKEVVTKKYLEELITNYASKEDLVKAIKILLDFWNLADKELNTN